MTRGTTARQVWICWMQAGKWLGARRVGKKTTRGGGGKEDKEWLEFLPPDAASLRSSEPSSYVYSALGRGRGGSQNQQDPGCLL